MKTMIQLKYRSLLLTLFCLLTIAIPQHTKAAAAPSLTGKWVVDVLKSAASGFLAGRIEWAVDTFIFKQSSGSRTGTLTASPRLEASAGTYTTITQIGNSATQQSFSTNADERYGRCTMEVARIAWDPDTQQYQSLSQQSFHAYQFTPNMAGINTAPTENGQYSGTGYWLIYGVSEKVDHVEHKISSNVSGDPSLASHGTFSYTGKIKFQLSNLSFHNGSWNWVPSNTERQRSATLSGIGASSETVGILEPNSRLHSYDMMGGSRLSWRKDSGTAVNFALPVGTPTPIQVSVPVKVWIVTQSTW